MNEIEQLEAKILSLEQAIADSSEEIVSLRNEISNLEDKLADFKEAVYNIAEDVSHHCRVLRK